MQYLFELDKENLKLSSFEIYTLSNSTPKNNKNKYLLIDSSSKEINFLSKRLALTRRVFKVLFETTEKSLVKNLESFNWQKIYNKDFYIKLEYNSKYEEHILAYHIWNNVKSPKVNLKNSKTPIHILKYKNKLLVTKLVKNFVHKFPDRKAHKRPKNHPSSLHPKLAKTIVNLTGIKSGVLVDAMCGAGGFLLEAGLMNIKTIGYDIDKEMLERSKQNLNYFKIKDYKLIHKDFLKVNRKIKFLVCDLPYGRNTKKQDLIKLYSKFLKHLRKILQNKAIIVFPKGYANYDKLIKDSKLKIDNRFEVYIHKSLTRVIYVLSV